MHFGQDLGNILFWYGFALVVSVVCADFCLRHSSTKSSPMGGTCCKQYNMGHHSWVHTAAQGRNHSAIAPLHDPFN
eukprot:534547-Amphidinium_carterae.1